MLPLASQWQLEGLGDGVAFERVGDGCMRQCDGAPLAVADGGGQPRWPPSDSEESISSTLSSTSLFSYAASMPLTGSLSAEGFGSAEGSSSANGSSSADGFGSAESVASAGSAQRRIRRDSEGYIVTTARSP